MTTPADPTATWEPAVSAETIEASVRGLTAPQCLLRTVAERPITARRIRCHGDFHLGQVLTAKDDVFIIDFEGEPRRSLAGNRCGRR